MPRKLLSYISLLGFGLMLVLSASSTSVLANGDDYYLDITPQPRRWNVFQRLFTTQPLEAETEFRTELYQMASHFFEDALEVMEMANLENGKAMYHLNDKALRRAEGAAVHDIVFALGEAKYRSQQSAQRGAPREWYIEFSIVFSLDHYTPEQIEEILQAIATGRRDFVAKGITTQEHAHLELAYDNLRVIRDERTGRVRRVVYDVTYRSWDHDEWTLRQRESSFTLLSCDTFKTKDEWDLYVRHVTVVEGRSIPASELANASNCDWGTGGSIPIGGDVAFPPRSESERPKLNIPDGLDIGEWELEFIDWSNGLGNNTSLLREEGPSNSIRDGFLERARQRLAGGNNAPSQPGIPGNTPAATNPPEGVPQGPSPEELWMARCDIWNEMCQEEEPAVEPLEEERNDDYYSRLHY